MSTEEQKKVRHELRLTRRAGLKLLERLQLLETAVALLEDPDIDIDVYLDCDYQEEPDDGLNYSGMKEE